MFIDGGQSFVATVSSADEHTIPEASQYYFLSRRFRFIRVAVAGPVCLKWDVVNDL